MKYLVMLCDGMADEPNAQLDNSTPMAKAVKPCMDYLASKGEVGMVKTVAEMSGFNDESYFCVVFKRQEKMSPLEFRRLHLGV